MQVFMYFTIFSTIMVAHVLVGVVALRDPHFADGSDDRTYATTSMISLLAALGGILNLFPILLVSLAAYAGHVHRVGELHESLLATVHQRREYAAHGSVRDGDMIRLANVTIRTPIDRKLLFNQLTFLVQSQQYV